MSTTTNARIRSGLFRSRRQAPLWPPTRSARSPGPSRVPAGKWTLDKKFNGHSDTTPEGVIYVVTGAGGQHLYNPEQQDDPGSWQEFTYKHVSKVHSLTVADIESKTLTIRQLTAGGDEVDRFVVTKTPPPPPPPPAHHLDRRPIQFTTLTG